MHPNRRHWATFQTQKPSPNLDSLSCCARHSFLFHYGLTRATAVGAIRSLARTQNGMTWLGLCTLVSLFTHFKCISCALACLGSFWSLQFDTRGFNICEIFIFMPSTKVYHFLHFKMHLRWIL
jgi:hypothetical protein